MFHTLDKIQQIQRWAASVESAQQRHNIELVNGGKLQWKPFVDLRQRMFEYAVSQQIEFFAQRIQTLDAEGNLKLAMNDSFVLAVQPQFGSDVVYRLKTPSGTYFPSSAGQRGFVFESKVTDLEQSGTWTHEWSVDGGTNWNAHSSSLIVHIAFRCRHCLKTVIAERDGDCRCHAFQVPRPLKRLRIPPTLRSIAASLKPLLLDIIRSINTGGGPALINPDDIPTFTFIFENAQRKLVNSDCIQELIEYVKIFEDVTHSILDATSRGSPFDISLPFEVQPYPLNDSTPDGSAKPPQAISPRQAYDLHLLLAQTHQTCVAIIRALQSFPKDDNMSLEALFERFRVPLTVTDQTNSRILANKLLNRLQNYATTIGEAAYVPALAELAYGSPVPTFTLVKPLFNVDTEYDIFEDRQWLDTMATLERERRMCFGFNTQLNRWNCCGRERGDLGCRKFSQHVSSGDRTYDLANPLYVVVTNKAAPEKPTHYYDLSDPEIAKITDPLQARVVPLNIKMTETYDLFRSSLETALRRAYESGQTLLADAMVMHANLHLSLNTPWNPASIRSLQVGLTPRTCAVTIQVLDQAANTAIPKMMNRLKELKESLDAKKAAVVAAAAAAQKAAAIAASKAASAAKKAAKKAAVAAQKAAKKAAAAAASAPVASGAPPVLPSAPTPPISSSVPTTTTLPVLPSVPATLSTTTTSVSPSAPVAPVSLPASSAGSQSASATTTATVPSVSVATPSATAGVSVSSPAGAITSPASASVPATTSTTAGVSVSSPAGAVGSPAPASVSATTPASTAPSSPKKESKDEAAPDLMKQFSLVLPPRTTPFSAVNITTSGPTPTGIDVFSFEEENKRADKDSDNPVEKDFEAWAVASPKEAKLIDSLQRDPLFKVSTDYRFDAGALKTSANLLGQINDLLPTKPKDEKTKSAIRALLSDTIRVRRQQAIRKLSKLLVMDAEREAKLTPDPGGFIAASENALAALANYPDARWNEANWRLQIAATARLLARYLLNFWYENFATTTSSGLRAIQNKITEKLKGDTYFSNWELSATLVFQIASSAIQEVLQDIPFAVKRQFKSKDQQKLRDIITKRGMPFYHALVLANFMNIPPFWPHKQNFFGVFTNNLEEFTGLPKGTTAVISGMLDDDDVDVEVEH